ncbi:MAG: outer membrane protein assembly factor BamD [Candidatus Marinimicrobia bacterium]|nr:outer membrane protein assembly factor BamD [Candidatus Neomarinimicrobiota bacterium]
MVKYRHRRQAGRVRLIALMLLAALYVAGCAGRKDTDIGTAEERFARGEELFADGKWLKASDQFNWVVLNFPASDMAAEAQYLYAECSYQRKLYVEAQLEFERFLRRWTATDRLVQARFRIVECLVAQSPKYFYSQAATEDALVEIQGFIDEFPGTPQSAEAESLIFGLRSKLARKLYESGRQYLKWRESNSAKLYFERVLVAYYDTPYADSARLGMIVAYIVAEDYQGARSYYATEAANFNDAEILNRAESYIASATQEKFDLAYYLNLYR